jgi:hypothetical protein
VTWWQPLVVVGPPGGCDPRRPAPGPLCSDRYVPQAATILGTVAETAAYDLRARKQQQPMIDQAVAALTTHISDAQRAGMADPHLDAVRTAHWLIWMIERGLYQLVGSADEQEVESQLDSLTEIVWRVVYLSGHQQREPS